MPGPYRKRLGAAVTLNADCVSCHEEEAAEWRGSRHRHSNTNPAYREAFAIEPMAFCRGCHAPESDPTKAPPRAVSELGVGCVTCHVTEEGFVLAAASSRRLAGPFAPADPLMREPEHRSGSRGPAGDTPHLLRRSVEFGRTGGCAGCHEFRFPAAPSDEDDHFMQTTVREHQRSRAAKKACAACHMPLVRGRRSHAFAQVRDPAWLRDNLRVTAERIDDDRVRITLLQPAPGHGFPSGDLFRRLEVGCELRGPDGRVIRREVRNLARHFVIVPGRPGRQLVRDDRVFDEPAVIEVPLPPPSPGPRSGIVSFWVTYQRVATVGVGTNPADAKIESEIRLHSGTLPWEMK